jgi:hypothetical protein
LIELVDHAQGWQEVKCAHDRSGGGVPETFLARALVPGVPAAADEWRLRQAGLACKRGALRHLPRAHAVGYPSIFDGFIFAYPSKRYRSALISIAVHSAQSVVFIGLTLSLVLKG